MFKKWTDLFSTGKEEVVISVEKEPVKKSILELVEMKKEKEAFTQDLTQDVMSGIMKFREETSSLDYLRNEIEQVLYQKDGEIKLMEGFANAMKQQKKS